MFSLLTRNRPVKIHVNGAYHDDEIIAKENSCDSPNKRIDFITNILSNHNLSQERFCSFLLSELARTMEICQGAVYLSVSEECNKLYKKIAGYAISPEQLDVIIESGQGFTGQAASDGKIMIVDEIPAGYLTIESGLGKSTTASLIIVPVMHKGKVLMILELASFKKFTDEDETFFNAISPSIVAGLMKSSDLN